MNRIVQPELLDALSPTDPRAARSRRDLRRINAWMRNHVILADALKSNLNGCSPKQITDLGAGDGNLLLAVAKKIAPRWSNVKVTLLDLQQIVSAEMLAAFSKLGWHAEVVIADVFNRPPASSEIVVANLFLHHFEDERLADLLRKISECARLFIVVEPHRFMLPRLCGGLLWLIGCNAVTRHDGVVSVRAGFSGNELSALWPDKDNWQLTERRAGFFSHLFVARRIS